MTNEEAAKVLRIMASGIELKRYPEIWISGFKEAYETAIKVLEERPQGDIFPMEIVAGKCPIEAGGNCPLRQKGEWIEDNGDLRCPFCKVLRDSIHGSFCPNCGARMNYQS